LFAGGLILGALRPTNTWDFPVYLTLGVAAVIVAGPLRHGWRSRQAYVESLISALALVGFFLLLYQPYTRWYGQGYNAADFWTGSRTTIRSYLVVHGLFLFPLMAWMVWETRQWMAATPLSQLARLRPYVGWIVFVILAALGVVVWGFAQGARITVVAVPLILWGLLLLLRPGIGWSKRVALVFTASALMLTLVVELVVLRGDIGRMNTVFKFYFQVWTLLGLSSVAAAFWTYEGLPQWSNGWRTVWSVGLTALVVGAALYPLTAASAKVRDRMAPEAPHTLDGAAYMQNAVYYDLGGELHFDEDARLIHWMQQNVQGSPVIVEANIPEYRWGSRVTVYTGLPGVLGWRWHQTQQRAVEGDPATQRAYEIADFYTNPSIEAAVDFLKRYDVRYVIVASQERLYYEFVSPCTPTVDGLSVTCDMAGRPLGMASPNVPPTDCSPLDPGNPALLVCPTHGIEKFESMVERGLLRVVYHDGAAEVYEVTS
jgi:YYY domain-containing protein